MQKIILVLIVLVLVIGAVYWWQRGGENPVPSEETPDENPGEFVIDGETWMRHRDNETGIQFAYRMEPDGYVLDDRMPTEPEAGGHVKTYILMLQSDAEELAESTEPREGPPTITVTIFDNNEMQSPRAWADMHAVESNIELAISDIEETTVAGADAIRFRSTGLYTYDTIVATHDSFVFVISGGFLTEDSDIRSDFDSFVESISFMNEI